ncbi:MAG: DUF3850 domain-containing protein [Candidatus Omnitrophota bacterium]|jgi:hypothetical protein
MNKKRHHELKMWPEYFRLLVDDVKLSDIRVDDRDIQDGDTVCFREFFQVGGGFTGNEVMTFATRVLRGGAIPKGYVFICLRKLSSSIDESYFKT